jgi:hypothetical protein
LITRRSTSRTPPYLFAHSSRRENQKSGRNPIDRDGRAKTRSIAVLSPRLDLIQHENLELAND